MMRVMRFSAILCNIKPQMGLGNAPGFYSYSTAAFGTTTTRSRWMGTMHKLYRRISPIGNPKVSIVPLLDQWVEEGNPVEKQQLKNFIKELRSYKRFTHALEISTWMTDKRYFELTPADAAIRVDLIGKVNGIEEAEKYFNCLSEKLRTTVEVFTALLNCYSYGRSVEKAEATMQKMKDLGLFRTTLVYNCMLKVYYESQNFEKLDSLMQEMDENDIAYDKFTFGTRINAYAAASDAKGIDKIVMMMEADHGVALDWAFYTSAANGYAKVGLLDKALAMLKKCEGQIKGAMDRRAYNFLLSQYASFGMKDEVLRIWEVYKKTGRVYNAGYISVIPAVLKFGDIESAEKIFEEWESQNLTNDLRIPNFMIGAYSRKGLLEKAETLVKRDRSKRKEINMKAWYYLAVGYVQHNQSEKAVEAMKEVLAAYQTPSRWKPDVVTLAACLDFFKDEGHIAGAENFIQLLIEKEIIPADLQDRLLINVQNRESNLETLTEFGTGSKLDSDSVAKIGATSEPEHDTMGGSSTDEEALCKLI